MEPDFKIFYPSRRFQWTTNKIFYSAILFGVLLMMISSEILNNKYYWFSKFSGMFLILLFFFGIGLKIVNFTRFRPFHGDLNGKILFEENSIIAGTQKFNLEEIVRIKIYNNDYSGKLDRLSNGNFGPALSNGTNNYLVLFLVDEEIKKFRFELVHSDDFQKIRRKLIVYNIKEKMSFNHLCEILGEDSDFERRELKNEIQRISTAANRTQDAIAAFR